MHGNTRRLWAPALLWLAGWSVGFPASSFGAPPAADGERRAAISFETKQLSDKFFAEGASFGDFNRDGKADIVAGPYWFAGPDFAEQHEYYPPKAFDPHGYSDNFFAFTYDFNGDGWLDILIIGFPGQMAHWFENPQGKAGHWKKHEATTPVDNESPTFTDIDRDGRPEIVCSQGGYFGYAAFDPQQPTRPWTFHRVSEQTAGGMFTHGLGVGDVNGDGRVDLMEAKGWWEQPERLAGDPVWKFHPFAFANGGAQMYAYDVNGDGRNDVITSVAAHGYGLVWWEQLPPADGKTDFKRHVILGDKPADNPYGVLFSQLHAVDLVDMDGDGLKDIVTGKRWWAHGPNGDPEPNNPGVVYWFQLVRDPQGGVDWVPHRIHGDSGVGTQVVAGDFSGDGRPDVVVGNKKGFFVHTQKVEQVSLLEWESLQPRKRRPMAQGLSPQDAAAAMSVPPGFSVQLFAGEPDVKQPIAMAIDDRGRLWIAEAYSYPAHVPDDQAKDRILIFEDTDGDGVFNTRKVFIEGLNLVSGIEVGFGGVWVGAAPNFLFIPDANGDDIPDGKPQVLLDGWGYQDTHETLNSFIWGPDGWLYGCHGVFTHSLVGKPGSDKSQRTPLNAAIWRYHPTRHEFEVFIEGTSNPWGVDFNESGDAFATACVIPHLYHLIPGARYQRQAGTHFNPHTYEDIQTIAKHRHWTGGQWNDADREKSDALGGGHAHAGAMVYQGGVWPKRYHNQLFMNNIHGARLNQDQLTPKGSGYEGDAAPDFLFANDVWSQLIYLTYGPDGQVYMIDWYDQNQCHHGRSDGHDRTNGRIFKVSYGKTAPALVNLTKWSDQELIAALDHTNEWYSRHARRQLQERAAAKKLVPSTRAELERLALSGPTVRGRLRALWALHVTGGAGTINQRLLADSTPAMRAWAIRLMFEKKTQAGAEPERIAAINKLAETDPTVQLAIASALQKVPPAERWTALGNLMHRADLVDDHNLPLMIWYAMEPCVMTNVPRAMEMALASKIPQVSRYIVRRAAAEDEAYEVLFTAIKNAPAAAKPWMVNEVAIALKTRGNVKMPQAWTATYDDLMASDQPVVRQQAEYIAVKFGDRRVFGRLRQVLADRTLELTQRELALDSLVSGKDPELPPTLFGLLTDPALRTKAINSLGAFDHPETAAKLIAAYKELPPTDQQAAIAVCAARPASVLALLAAIEREQVPRNDLTAFTVRQIARLNHAEVTKRLNEVWGTLRDTPEDKTADLAKYKTLLSKDFLAKANLSHGRELFNKTCAACHTLFGSGKQIGPDLTGSNRANLDYLLENLIDPSAVVGRDYQMTAFQLNNGRVVNGIVRQENAETVTVQTPTELAVLVKSEIDERQLSPLSLMPEGQLKQLPPEDARDLVAYLRGPGQVALPGEAPLIDPQTKRVVDAIEGESLKVIKVQGGNTSVQGMQGFSLGKWSGNEHLWWTGAKPGSTLELGWTTKTSGTYEVFVVLTKAPDYAEVKFTLNGKPIDTKVDLYHEGVINTEPISLGTFALGAGEQRLRVEVVGANPKAAKEYMFGIDYVWLKARQ